MPNWEIPEPLRERIQGHLTFLYSQETGALYWDKLHQTLSRFVRRNPGLQSLGAAPGERLTEADAILITYGDQVTEPDQPPLQTLAEFLSQRLRGAINGVHILPFFPYSSDDGFSVIDYSVVNPILGTWDDLQPLRANFRLMYDLVINHVSVQSAWFQGFLRDAPVYTDYFIVVEPDADLSLVTRPRALPLLTHFQTPSGEKLVWTTFSADQVDLNFANPEVLLAIVQVMLLYVEKGAELIRLDAIAYLWKIVGTTCIHLEQTHRVVQLLRAVLDAVAPRVLLITETNVPHAENVSYFGDGADEAQMVYQFSLAPLTLDAFHSGDARQLARWAEGLQTPAPTTTFFNFTASHDGIGVRPAEGILDASAFQRLVDKAQAHGGHVSFKTNSDGSTSPYELNISYFDALSDPAALPREGLETQIRRFIASQAIMLSLAGVPGVYVHSLFGSRSYHAGVQETGRYRSINREKLRCAELKAALADPTSLRCQVFERYVRLLRLRTTHKAFHPNGLQKVLALNPTLFSLLRASPDGLEHVLCLHNVSDQEQRFEVNLDALGVPCGGAWLDLLTEERYLLGEGGELAGVLSPYQVLWLKA